MSHSRAKTAALAVLVAATTLAHAAAPVPLGNRRELFVDRHLIQSLSGGARLRLHHPVPREIAVTHDKPWEGNTCCYHTVFKDGDRYRMYYRGSHAGAPGSTRRGHPEFTCYAESTDGIHWTKPDLGLFEFDGSTRNNIVWAGAGTHNFAPFKDSNPDCRPEAAYKAIARGRGGLIAFQSPDGIHWELMQKEAVITKGRFDSQNLAFWDPIRKCYVDYHRGRHWGVRAIMTCTSTNFIDWTEPVFLEYPDGTPREELYTNQILPYPRAPHVRMGFPKRFLPSRRIPGNARPGLSDGVFMTSRDGLLFHRWTEAFIRPGPQRERWVNRNNMTAWGMVETAATRPGCPDELSLYSTEGYYQGDSCAIRRFTLRRDGFVSAHAPMRGGELLTKTLTFTLPPGVTTNDASARLAATPAHMLLVRHIDPIRGRASLHFDQPAILPLPGTRELGSQVTLALAVKRMRRKHCRLFSAYNGGPVARGTRELILDCFPGSTADDGSVIRFLYDGLAVRATEEEIPDWTLRSTNETLHIAATWDDGAVTLYLDGQPVATGGEPGYGALTLALGELLIGEDYPPTSLVNEAFDGIMDDILVLRRVLAPDEIARLAADGPDALVEAGESGILYTMEPDADSTVTDRLTADGASDTTAIDPVGARLDGACQLLLNYATSAAGSLRVELRDADGTPIPGFTLEDCDPVYGDELERVVSWKRQTELAPLAGRHVALRFELKDADVYAIRFGGGNPFAADAAK